jgi:hypothetical protein
MAESAASYQLFSWFRQGLLAGLTNSASAASVTDGHLVLPIHLRVNTTAGFDVPIQLYGPGDITGLDAREVIRIEPPRQMADFEPNYFPHIEFDRPDFPWLFTPAKPDAANRLMPWICLVVVRKDRATISANPNQPLPVLECSQQELPNLEQSWAWAHSQIVSGNTNMSDPSNHETLKQVLKQNPERTLSRLLGARRLDPNTAYYACLVPTYAIGRKAGIGEKITQEDEQALKPAWVFHTSGQADESIKLPLYFHWEFRTGLAGDFESLARRLEPKQLPDTVGLRPLDVSAPGWGMPVLSLDAPGAILDMEGALRTPGTKPREWSANAKSSFRNALRTILNLPAAQEASHAEAALLGPPLYGQWYAEQQMVPAEKTAPHWFRELNLDPRLRVAAGLGTLAVRYEQEQLMASAWDQLAKQAQDNQRLKRAQLAETVGDALLQKHIAPLAASQLLRVTNPVQMAANDNVRKGMSMLQLAQSPISISNPALSSACRRLTRSGGPLSKRIDRIRADQIGGHVALAGTRQGTAGVMPVAASTAIRRGFINAPTHQLQVVKTNVLNQLDAKAAVLAVVRKTAPAADSTDLIRFAPEFPQPMYELLRDYFNGMLLPGIEHVPNNTIALLETNQMFIEAYMVGLNHEMSRELLWRGYPTDQRGTYFRQFWDVRGSAQTLDAGQREKLKDITQISTWKDEDQLGQHGLRNSADSQMVLLIRGDLLRRYPRAMIYAVEAVWSADKTRRELGTVELYPAFRATQGGDITMLGFLLTEQQVRGTDDATAGGHPGWFFVLQEQPTEPRFGIDVATTYGGTPQHWRDLTWGHLATTEESFKQIVYVPIDGLLKDVSLDHIAWGRNSAYMASITRQRPFRVAIHARTWLPEKKKEN